VKGKFCEAKEVKVCIAQICVQLADVFIYREEISLYKQSNVYSLTNL